MHFVFCCFRETGQSESNLNYAFIRLNESVSPRLNSAGYCLSKQGIAIFNLSSSSLNDVHFGQSTIFYKIFKELIDPPSINKRLTNLLFLKNISIFISFFEQW